MFGHFSKYLILIFSICVFSSCLLFEEEEEIKDVYIDFPVQYDHVIKHIRGLQKNDFLPVKSKSGISDQLFCNSINNSKDHTFYKRIIILDSKAQTIFAQKFEQKLIPSLYNFYTINYSMYLNPNNIDDSYNPLDYCLQVYLNNNILFKINLIDSSITTNYTHIDLGSTDLDTLHFNHLYKFDLPVVQFINNEIKCVYFDMQKGVVRFDTYGNEIFYIN